MKKIGLFGGSFDPIHFGHLSLCVAIMEEHQLDQILFCPVAVSPFKEAAPPQVSQEHRLEMVRLGISLFPKFQLIEFELERPAPSYTIDTVKALKQRFEDQREIVQLHLILGGDTLPHLPLWREVEELIRLAPPLIGSRGGGYPSTMPRFSSQILAIVTHGLTPIPMMDISSTMIRERLCQQKTCRHLMPANVLDYIEAHQLYSHVL